jgi:hypothetical protein
MVRVDGNPEVDVRANPRGDLRALRRGKTLDGRATGCIGAAARRRRDACERANQRAVREREDRSVTVGVEHLDAAQVHRRRREVGDVKLV